MKLRTLIWFEFIWALVPLCLLLGTTFTASVIPASAGYALAAHTAALGAWVLILPVASLCCCLVARRLVRGGLTRGLLVRRLGLRRVALHVLPISCTTTVVVLVVVFLYSAQHDVTGVLELPLVLATLTAATAYSGLGFALGSYLSGMVAAPIALLVPYLLIAFPPAMPVLWVRHLFYVENGCCDVSQVLSTRALLACILTSLAVAVGSAGFAALRLGRGPHPVATVGITATLIAVAIGAAHGLGATATSPRAVGLHCRPVATGMGLCLWPEHEGARTGATDLLARVAAVASTRGVIVPRLLTEQTVPTSTWPTVPVNLVPTAPTPIRAYGLLVALAPAPTDACIARVSAERAFAGSRIFDVAPYLVGAWWSSQVGVRVDIASSGEPGALRTALNSLAALPPADQVRVINQTDGALRACRPLTDLAGLR